MSSDCDGFLLLATPLFQLNFLPDLTHVKVFPDATDFIPTFGHAPPALIAAFTGTEGMSKETETIETIASSLLFI
jgi:hypothetical protein